MTLHVVTGPTASGKTDYAIKLAKDIGGELINADSRQIYKYLNIGTNKGKVDRLPTNDTINGESYPVFNIEESGVPIHLINFLEPDQVFSAHQYQQLVYTLLPQIQERGNVPILVGGTGMYIDFVINPERHSDHGEVDEKQRKELNKLSKEQLQSRLSELDAGVLEAMNDSDQQNPRRLIRAIEKLTALDTAQTKAINRPDFKVKTHLIELPLDQLTEKINRRVIEMWEEGLRNEVAQVLDMGYSTDSVALQGIGYREVIQHLSGTISRKECIEKIQTAHRQYAKRQITWFRKYLS